MKPSRGYTLLEIMVALVVFAILSTITALAMYHAFDTRSRVDAQANQLNTLQLVLAFLSRDIEQITNRAVRGTEMRLFPPFIGEKSYVEFTEGGLVNPGAIEQRSSLKRVAYRCVNQSLIRETWQQPDSTLRTQHQDKTLLTNLSACSFAYLNKSRQVLSEWRPYAIQQDQKEETLPIAIQITVTTQNWGNMSLLFVIPEGLYA